MSIPANLKAKWRLMERMLTARPENEKKDRKNRRLAENQNPNKCCVITIRQRGKKGEGAIKTKTFTVKSEAQANIKKLAVEHINFSSIVHADEAGAYDILHGTHL